MISKSLLVKLQAEDPQLAIFLGELLHEVELAQVEVKRQNELIDKLYKGLDHPTCRIYGATQSIPNSAWTTIVFTSERWDTHDMFDTSKSTVRIVVPFDGMYLLGGQIQFAGSSTGGRFVRLLVNGATEIGMQSLLESGLAYDVRLIVVSLASLTAGSYVELQVWQNSGAALNINSFLEQSPEFWATRVADPVILSLYEQSLGDK